MKFRKPLYKREIRGRLVSLLKATRLRVGFEKVWGGMVLFLGPVQLVIQTDKQCA